MKPACVLLVAIAICASSSFSLLNAQTSNGVLPLATKIVVSSIDSNCSMTDIGAELINERVLVCGAGQVSFFNGEIRFVDSGTGMYGSITPFNGYELTSCACSQNATWTRTMDNETSGEDSIIRWTYKFYARKDDCSLQLKRDLQEYGCSYRTPCDCLAEQVCSETTEICEIISPIAIDLDGDGLRMTDREHGVEFDLNADGERQQMPWLAEDGWLVLNDYEDGVVRDGRQLFGDRSAQENLAGEQRNGYAALRTFDDNQDAVIDRGDGVWPILAIWRDLNHNGVSDAGEVVNLTNIGLKSISLDYRESRRQDPHGNELRYRSRVEWLNGRHTSSWDVFLTAK